MTELPPHLRAIAPDGAHVARPHAGDMTTARGGPPAENDGGFRRDFVVPKTAPVMVRDASTADWADIWSFLRALLAAGETICLPNVMMGSDARTLWFGGPDTEVVVAVDPREKPAVENPHSPIVGRTVGSASMRTARDGHGNHVARADFVIDPRMAGQGIEQELGIAVLTRARAAGFGAVEIDPVVATDADAIEAWHKLDFEIVGTRPRAFDHPREGPVGLHVMMRQLR